jgi:hypothetical protein
MTIMKGLLLLLLLIPVISFSQRGEFGLGFSTDFPIKSTMQGARVNTGFNMRGGYSPFARLPLYFELTTTWSGYGRINLDQNYYTSEEEYIFVDVDYRNKLNRTMLGSKLFFNHAFHKVRPYVSGHFGFTNVKTRMVATDPNNQQDPSVKNKVTFRDVGWAYAGEIGLEIDFSKVFTNIKDLGASKFTISMHYLGSPNSFNYTNVKNLVDAPGFKEEWIYDKTGTVENDFSEPDYPYTNISTENIAEQKVSEVHTSKLAYLGFQISYILHF